MVLFELVPFVYETDAGSADFVEFFLVVNHFCARGAGDEIVLAEEDGLFRANFFTHAAVDAADHIDIELTGAFFDFCPFIIGGDFRGGDFDCFWGADEFAKLA